MEAELIPRATHLSGSSAQNLSHVTSLLKKPPVTFWSLKLPHTDTHEPAWDHIPGVAVFLSPLSLIHRTRGKLPPSKLSLSKRYKKVHLITTNALVFYDKEIYAAKVSLALHQSLIPFSLLQQ